MTALGAPPAGAPPGERSRAHPWRPSDPHAAPGAGPDLAAVALATAVALGVVIRAYLVLSRDFPLNDGGLFYAMADDLRRNGFRLPPVTSYNGAGLPFGYSPLGIYLAAAFSALGVPLMQTLRAIPLVATCLTVPAFALLARELLPSRIAQIAAVFAFAVLPRSFTWLLMGGGLTRSLGYLFALLAIGLALRLFRGRELRWLPWVTLATAAGVLAHLGTAPFLVVSFVLMFAAYGRDRRTLGWSVVIAIGTALLSAPWWATVIAQHGLGPFRAAAATGQSILSPGLERYWVLMTLAHLGIGTSGEPMGPVIWALALAGAVLSVARVRLVLPIWWPLVLAFDGRQGATLASAPVALLAGVAVAEAWTLLGARTAPSRPLRRRAVATAAVLCAAIAYTGTWALNREPAFGGEGWTLEPLRPSERDAMAWVRRALPAESRFLVVSGVGWPTDRWGEWFPVLAGRRSVATVQGYEWAPDRSFARRVQRHARLQACAREGAPCLESWLGGASAAPDFLYVPRVRPYPCCERLLQDLATSPAWQQVYEGAGARVFRRVGAGARARGLRRGSGSVAYRP